MNSTGIIKLYEIMSAANKPTGRIMLVVGADASLSDPVGYVFSKYWIKAESVQFYHLVLKPLMVKGHNYSTEKFSSIKQQGNNLVFLSDFEVNSDLQLH